MKTKIMKLCRLTVLFSLTLIAAPVRAQAGGDQAANPNRMVVPLSHPSQPAQVNLTSISGDISVHGYTGNQVIIERSGERSHRHDEADVPEEARGMQRLASPADLNADEDNNVVTIHGGLRGGSIDLQVPAGSSLSLKTVNGSVQVQGVSGELEIESTNGGVTLDQAGGSIVAHTLNGQITANVARLDTGKPSSFSTMNGRIDLTLPAALHANLTMRSDRGDIYLDQGFDFKPLPNPSGSTTKSESNGMTKIRMDNTIRGTINGGGAEIDIRTFNGPVLVHKGK
jgi:Putative adhesin